MEEKSKFDFEALKKDAIEKLGVFNKLCHVIHFKMFSRNSVI